MSDLYGLVIWIESVCILSRICTQSHHKGVRKPSGSCGLSERSMRMAVCQPTGGEIFPNPDIKI